MYFIEIIFYESYLHILSLVENKMTIRLNTIYDGLKEIQHINKSLSTLRNIIYDLTNIIHVLYYNKLIQILVSKELV